MSIKIGHSSIDENNKISGGTAGDQTEKEVCIRSWYSKPWQFMLRCKDSNKAELMAIACEKGCENKNLGYDQGNRNSLNTQAKKVNYDLSKITTPCECDCSSFMTVCAQSAGINIPYNGTNAPTTSTMKSAFLSTGMFEVLTDSKYLTSDAYLKRGDILVKAGSHTVMALENGSSYNSSASTTPSANVSTQKCIDVSSYQSVINWNQVKNGGITLAILRGVTKNGNMDTTFDTNYQNAKMAGVNIIGVYHFSYALDESTSKKDAENMINKLNGRKLDIYLDLEWANQGLLGKTNVTSIAKTYVNVCKSHGYTCHIYSNLDWYKNKYNASELSALGCKFWIARYPASDNGTVKDSLKPNISEYIWQYSSKGKVPGINGNVDMNIVYNYVESNGNTQTTIPSNSITETSITLLGKITTTSSNLTIRSQPNTESVRLGYYTKSSIVQLIAKTSSGWYRTDKGYISGSYVSTVTGQVYNCGGLNFRTSSDPGAAIIRTLKPSDEMMLLKEENGWYNAKLNDGTIGWVSKKYIRIL